MAHPRMYDDASPALNRLRKICLALPHTFEKEAWGECTYRVTGGSMFAMSDSHHHGSDHIAVWVKAPPMAQEILVNADAKRFFVPPYVGAKGWVGVRLDYKVDWDELADILKDAYRMSAPKRLLASLSPTTNEAPASSGAAKRRRSASTSKGKRAAATKQKSKTDQRSKRAARK